MRVAVRVQPSASRTVVGGSHSGALVVRVVEPPERGRATGAALRAVAEALGVSTTSVALVRGTTSRQKLLEIRVREGDEARLGRRLQDLLHHGTDGDWRPSSSRA
jgi:uncharacterized protein